MGGEFQRRSAALCIFSCPPVHVPGGSDLLGLLPVMGADFEKFVSARLLGLLPVCRVRTLRSLLLLVSAHVSACRGASVGEVLGGSSWWLVPWLRSWRYCGRHAITVATLVSECS